MVKQNPIETLIEKNKKYLSKMSFKDKIVVITGATRGIGYEIAKQFAEQHAHVIISGRNVDTCTSIANKLAQDTNGNVEGISLDLANTQSCKTFVANVIEKHSKIDTNIKPPQVIGKTKSLYLSIDSYKKTARINNTIINSGR